MRFLRQNTSLEKVLVVCFSHDVYEAYQRNLKAMEEGVQGGE